MDASSDVKPLSEALSAPIAKAYKIGGYGVVLIFSGTMLLLIALVSSGGLLRYAVGGVGALMIWVVLAAILFYLPKIKTLVDAAQDTLDKNEDLINAVQETAISMVNLADTLQAVAFKNAGVMSTTLAEVRTSIQAVTSRPFVSSIPGFDRIEKIVDNPYLIQAETLSQSVITTTSTAKPVIEGVKTALAQSDLVALNQHLAKIKTTDADAQALLNKPT